jgi:hypothetical protein
MGTRSTYRIIEQYSEGKRVKKIKETPICLVYVQYDGYPSGHPSEIAEWLAGSKVVNGFGVVEPHEVIFNGAGCLAAQLVHKLKKGTGGVYLHQLSNRGECGEDYLYDIIVKEDYTIEFVCIDNWDDKKELFRGTPQEFVNKFQKQEA